MKKVTLILLIISLVLIASCSEDFDINAPHEDIYVLNCILQNENSIQYAVLSKNIYTESGGYPSSNGTVQSIKGAKVKILYDNSEFVMRDTTLQIVVEGNTNVVNCYYIKNLIVNGGKNVSIEATAPNGKILKSTIQIPLIVFPTNFNYTIPPGFPQSDYFFDEFQWGWRVNNMQRTDIINLPQIEVYYKKNEGGTFIEKKIIIPLGSFTVRGYSTTPIYISSEPSYNHSAKEFFDIINSKMQEISGNDPYKRNYIIKKAKFSVLAIDPLLSKYYSESSTYSLNFSLKLFPPDYSNIVGGKGIFGMYYNYSISAKIDSLYVYSFGYQFDPHY